MKKFVLGFALALIAVVCIGAAGIALRRDANLSDVADPATSRANLGADNAANLTTGTLPDARLGASVSLLGQTIDLAAEVTGTIPDARLTANVALIDQINQFTASTQTIDGDLGVVGLATAAEISSDLITTDTLHFTNILFFTNYLSGQVINYSLGNRQETNMSADITFTGIINFDRTKVTTLNYFFIGHDTTPFDVTIPDEIYTTDGLRTWVITNDTRARLTIEVWGNSGTNASLQPLW